MKSLKHIAIIAIATMSLSALADDPNGKTLIGMGKERISVEHCGTSSNILALEKSTQGSDTFDLMRKTVAMDSSGHIGMIQINMTGSYSYTSDTAYMMLDKQSMADFTGYLQNQVSGVCGAGYTVIGRSVSVVRNDLHSVKNGEYVGVMVVKAGYSANDGNGSISYTLRTNAAISGE